MSILLTAARRDELIDALAARVGAWRLQSPAILLLSMHLPLAFIGSQCLLAAQPFVSFFTDARSAGELALLFEEPANVERLLARLEASAREAH